MKYLNILHQTVNKIAEIKLNRPNVLNSFNFQMADEVLHALEKCNNDQNIRAIILSGAGRAFCAGQDLEEATKSDGPTINEIINHTYNPLVKKIKSVNKPVICFVNGIAAGAGANLAICCDVTFAAKSAKFIQSFINIGLVPDTGGTYYLPRIIGRQKAIGLMFSGEKISSEVAEKIGMIYKSVEDENGYEIAYNFAKKLSLMPTKSMGLIKNLVNQSFENNLAEQLDLENKLQTIASSTKDYKEGVNAFLEKRNPNYVGE